MYPVNCGNMAISRSNFEQRCKIKILKTIPRMIFTETYLGQ